MKLAAKAFCSNADEIVAFTKRAETRGALTDMDVSWCYDLAVIRVYREFEDLMLSCLIALINSDASTFSAHKRRNFPNHMNVEVCEFLICGDGYFDFSGRSGLITSIKRGVPASHWLLAEVKAAKYKSALDQLCALRNFAAHDSAVSKKRALEVMGQKRMSSSGAWLKKQDRLEKICSSLKTMAHNIEAAAPY